MGINLNGNLCLYFSFTKKVKQKNSQDYLIEFTLHKNGNGIIDM